MDKYEFVVLGLGAMGSAAAFQLAKRGRKVLGIDQFAPPHRFGSSHGENPHHAVWLSGKANITRHSSCGRMSCGAKSRRRRARTC